jgi:hypothetical protein
MKITKQRLQEIILEEMNEAGMPLDAEREKWGVPQEEEEPAGEEKFTRQTAIAGEKVGGSATERARAASAVTAREGALLSIIQALRTEIGEEGEVEDVSGVTRDLMRGLGKARKQ